MRLPVRSGLRTVAIGILARLFGGGRIEQVLTGSAGVASAKLDLAVQVCKKLLRISKRYAFPQMGRPPHKVGTKSTHQENSVHWA